MEGGEYPPQNTESNSPDELPTYNYLESQERDNPNSRYATVYRAAVVIRSFSAIADSVDGVVGLRRGKCYYLTIGSSLRV